MSEQLKRMILTTTLCGLGYMMYSVDRMTLSSTISLIAQDFGLSTTISGVLLSSFFYGFIAFLFLSGIVSDKLTGKPVLIAGLLTFSVATALTGVADGLGALIAFRIITGIGEGLFWPAASLEVANVTSERQRTTVMSLYWTGYPIGGFFGTWLGATLSVTHGWRLVFYVAGGLGILIALTYAFFVKPAPKTEAPAAKAVPAAEKVSLGTLFKNRGVILMALYYFVLLSGWWIVLLWAPSFLMKVKHLPIDVAGTIAGLLGITGAVGGYVIGRFCDKGDFRRKRAALIGVTLLAGAAMAALALDASMPVVVCLILFLGFIGYPVTPMVLSFTSELVPASQRGAALGLVTNVGMAAGGISPVLAGYFAQTYTMEPVWVAAAVVMAVAAVLLIPVRDGKTVAAATAGAVA